MLKPSNDPSIPAVEIRIPFSTILTVIVTAIGLAFLCVISPLFLPVFIAALLAVALSPIVRWLSAKGLPRALSIAIVTVVLLAAIILILWLVVPEIGHQASAFVESLPQLRNQMLEKLGPHNPVRGLFDTGLKKEILNPAVLDVGKIWGAGNLVLSGFAELVLIFIFAIYLLLDGPRLIEWCRAFFAPKTQKKIDQTLSEVGEIVFAYVLGQMITSALSFIFVFAVLSAMGVPNVLLLATIAGVLDVLPVLGFFMAVIPAMLFALEVSVETSLFVFALYVLYHALENYLIVPFVYGNRLRVSSFVVFFALLAAGLIGGIEGAIAVLPIVASYPVIERIWLSPYMRKDTLEIHDAVSEK